MEEHAARPWRPFAASAAFAGSRGTGAVRPEIQGLASFGDVRVLAIDLRLADLGACLAVLSGAERARADRLAAHPRAQRRFAAARAGLRALLGGHLGVDPGSLVFGEGPQGKPELLGGPHFSLSHSQDLALCALSPSRRLGVDVEALRPVAEAEAIARRWFTASEMEVYEGARAVRPDEAFFRVWTRKEAYLKALGTGLAGLSAHADPDHRRWEVRDLDPGARYLAALVVERPGEG